MKAILEKWKNEGRMAFVFIGDDLHAQQSLTYTQWYHGSQSLAKNWKKKGVKAGQVVALDARWNKEYLFCLGAAALLDLNILLYFKYFPEEYKSYIHWSINSGEENLLVSNAPGAQIWGPVPGGGLILLSSGTTGKPKAIWHSLDGMAGKYHKLKQPFTTLTGFSADHVSGIEMVMANFYPGGTLIIPEKLSPTLIARLVQEYAIDILSGTPTLLKLLYITNCFSTHKLPGLQIIQSGGERVETVWRKKWQEALPSCKFYIGFGTTETANIRTYTQEDDWISLGEEGVDFKIIAGELWVKNGPSRIGIWPKLQEEQGEWHRTGDAAESAGNGTFRIIKRNDNMVIIGGEKVYPEEIEVYLSQFSEILDASVKGIPNALSGQILEARLTVHPFPSDLLSYKKQLRDKMKTLWPEFKIPQKIVLRNLPEMTNRGKKD